VNILLKDDERAMVFGQKREDLEHTYQMVAQSFAARVGQYFAGFPELAVGPMHVPAGCQAKVSLVNYPPPMGLSRDECATCLIRTFIKEAHESAKHEKSQFDYVKSVAHATLERWQAKFLENMMRLERECLMQLQQQISQLMQIGGLIDHSEWQASLRDLITSPVEAVSLSGIAGSIVGIYGGVLAEVIAGAGLTVGFGLGAMVFLGLSAIMLPDSALGRKVGLWDYEDGQMRAAQTVLDILNKPEFQAKAKELVRSEFERRLRVCIDQLADLRDPSTSSAPEAQAALGIQHRVAELQRALSSWFSRFVNEQVGRDPWLVQPPADLRAALDAESASPAASPSPCGASPARVPPADGSSDSDD